MRQPLNSIEPEPQKPLLPIALDMFMFQLHYVKQPPTSNVLVLMPLCVVWERPGMCACVCPSTVGEITVLPERSHFSAG